MLDAAANGPAPPAAAITRLPPASRAFVQCRPPVRAMVSAAIGLPLPIDACRANVRDNLAALWLGPDEWLLLGPQSESWFGSLLRNVDGMACSVVDISDRQVAFAALGPGAETVLAAGCPLDLHPSAFPVGMCTRTLFHRAPMVLWRTDADRFHIEVARSFGAYAEALLTLAATDG